VLDEDGLYVVGVADEEEGAAEDLQLDDIAVLVGEIAEEGELTAGEVKEVADAVEAGRAGRAAAGIDGLGHRIS
jgi:hypothetical protein